jgi:hypothetical protein
VCSKLPNQYLDKATEKKKLYTRVRKAETVDVNGLRIAKPCCQGLKVPFLFKRGRHLGHGDLLRRIPFTMSAWRNGRNRRGSDCGRGSGRAGRSGGRRLPEVAVGYGESFSLLLIGVGPWAKHSLNNGALVGRMAASQNFTEGIQAIAQGSWAQLVQIADTMLGVGPTP